jgi:hypothetical protein
MGRAGGSSLHQILRAAPIARRGAWQPRVAPLCAITPSDAYRPAPLKGRAGGSSLYQILRAAPIASMALGNRAWPPCARISPSDAYRPAPLKGRAGANFCLQNCSPGAEAYCARTFRSDQTPKRIDTADTTSAPPFGKYALSSGTQLLACRIQTAARKWSAHRARALLFLPLRHMRFSEKYLPPARPFRGAGLYACPGLNTHKGAARKGQTPLLGSERP